MCNSYTPWIFVLLLMWVKVSIQMLMLNYCYYYFVQQSQEICVTVQDIICYTQEPDIKLEMISRRDNEGNSIHRLNLHGNNHLTFFQEFLIERRNLLLCQIGMKSVINS